VKHATQWREFSVDRRQCRRDIASDGDIASHNEDTHTGRLELGDGLGCGR
jgi:hypothetical protein